MDFSETVLERGQVSLARVVLYSAVFSGSYSWNGIGRVVAETRFTGRVIMIDTGLSEHNGDLESI